jgi:hypothetical protein
VNLGDEISMSEFIYSTFYLKIREEPYKAGVQNFLRHPLALDEIPKLWVMDFVKANYCPPINP